MQPRFLPAPITLLAEISQTLTILPSSSINCPLLTQSQSQPLSKSCKFLFNLSPSLIAQILFRWTPWVLHLVSRICAFRTAYLLSVLEIHLYLSKLKFFLVHPNRNEYWLIGVYILLLQLFPNLSVSFTSLWKRCEQTVSHILLWSLAPRGCLQSLLDGWKEGPWDWPYITSSKWFLTAALRNLPNSLTLISFHECHDDGGWRYYRWFSLVCKKGKIV